VNKNKIDIEGYDFAYFDIGQGNPVIFLHGNPTSSYLWRNIIPTIAHSYRCIVPDLIGMGDSDKIKDATIEDYSFLNHYKFLKIFLEKMNFNQKVFLVLHDWGSALGFNWAMENEEKIKGICYMESIVKPYSWNEFPSNSIPIFKKLRGKDGEKMILEDNLFIERILLKSIIRDLTEEEINSYRRPFSKNKIDRLPMLAWPRQLPIEGEPKEVFDIVSSYSNWFSKSLVNKLFINSKPGALMTRKIQDFCRNFKNQEEVIVKGIHFLQEDSSLEIAKHIKNWLTKKN